MSSLVIHPPEVVVHMVDSKLADDRVGIGRFWPNGIDVNLAGLIAKPILDKKHLRISRKSFMDPKLRIVPAAHTISPPFVRKLMEEDLRRNPALGKILIGKILPVFLLLPEKLRPQGHGTLMLHGMGSLQKLDPIPGKRIRAKILLKGLQNRNDEIAFLCGDFPMAFQKVVFHVQFALQ